MDTNENYVYQSEVNWSILTEGLTLPVKTQVVFSRNMGRFLQRGESKQITLYHNGKGYSATIRNVNFDSKFNRKKDTLQIRYSRNGELAKALQTIFCVSYDYIKIQRELLHDGNRAMIKLPANFKEYIAIYTTEYEDAYILDTIQVNDVHYLKQIVQDKPERAIESSFNYRDEDKSANIFEDSRTVKIRKLNRKIGDNLKLLYSYKCQICGQSVGKLYGALCAESHHIDYFVNSLNNDANNQLIVCPDHHSIIHETNPTFDRQKLIYTYPNGYREGLQINYHLN